MKTPANILISPPLAKSETLHYDFYSSSTAILICFSCWVTFYFTVRYMYPDKSPEWASRVVTLFHGVGAAINGLSECFVEGNGLFEHVNEPHTDNQQVILVVSLGYFMLDTIWCLYYQTESTLMLGHHLFSVFALYRMLWKNVAGAQTVCALGGMEVTNPILQMRWFLRSEGFRDTKIFTYIELVFVVFFFMMRIGFGTYFFINITFMYKNDWEYILMAASLYLISIMFVIKIIQYMFTKYFPDEKAKKSSINAANG